MYDPPHLLKSLRNNLQRSTILFKNGRKATWDALKAAYNLDLKSQDRLMPKISSKHIYGGAFTAMKVSTAAQCLSNTASAAIKSRIAEGSLNPDLEDSAELLKFGNDVFDCCNISQLHGPTPLASAISSTNTAPLQYLKQAKDVFKTMKIVRKDGSPVPNIQFISGWIQTITVIELMSKELLRTTNVKFILTRKFCQDSLENFFGLIRRKGGSSENPTPIKFKHLFKQVFVNKMLRGKSTGNCKQDTNIGLLQLVSQRLKEKRDSSGHPVKQHFDSQLTGIEASMLNEDVCPLDKRECKTEPSVDIDSQQVSALQVDMCTLTMEVVSEECESNVAEPFADTGLIMIVTASHVQQKPRVLSKNTEQNQKNTEIRAHIGVNNNLINMQSFSYNMGALVKRILKLHICDTCQKHIKASNALDSPSKIFTHFKAYNPSDEQPFGGLTVPSKALQNYIRQAYKVFVDVYNTRCYLPGFVRTCIELFKTEHVPPPSPCPLFPVDECLNYYFRTRMYYTLKFLNAELSSKQHKKNRKLHKMKNL
jgi:hypothetical protein